MTPDQLPARIASKIEVVDGHWLWQCVRNVKRGEARYGMVRWGKTADGRFRTAYAHRVVWHLLIDRTFPVYGGWDGQQLDHVDCPHKHCVNPTCLEPVSNAENTRRYWATQRDAA